MPPILPRRRQAAMPLAVAGLLTLVLVACGSGKDGGSTTSGKGANFPMTVENCGNTVTIEKSPGHVVTVGDPSLNNVAAAGGLNKIVGHANASIEPVFDEATAAWMKNVPILDKGGQALSKEAILGVKTDLVIGEVLQGVGFDDLKAVDIPLLINSGNCSKRGAGPDQDGRADFADVENDVTLYGRIFGTQNQAASAVADIRARVAAIRSQAANFQAKNPGVRTAAALYIGGKTVAAYGSASMSHAQFEILGLRNVFADTDKRFFEPNIEEIVKRNPDILMVLTYAEPGIPAPTLKDVKALTGMDTVTAVKNGDVLILPYAYSSQGTVAVEGLERMAKAFGLVK